MFYHFRDKTREWFNFYMVAAFLFKSNSKCFSDFINNMCRTISCFNSEWHSYNLYLGTCCRTQHYNRH